MEFPEGIASPSLLVHPERIRHNIKEMLRVAGDAGRLRPHVKTHKCREIIALQMEQGINKFKCATIAEAEMLALSQVKDVLLAYQPTGPNIYRLIQLMQQYPETAFSALIDNMEALEQLERLVSPADHLLGLFIDVDLGMHRTGIPPGPAASELKSKILKSAKLKFRGWHLYDGHIRHSDFDHRRDAAEQALGMVWNLISDDPAEEIVAGGSPTFPVHALNPRFNLSPGTCLLWDQGYSDMMPDQQFKVAAVLITRVISKPLPDLVCLDLGHKALASEMPHPRVYLPALETAEFVSHSEEHLVVRSSKAANLKVGDVLYGVPMHICPTVALHQEMVVIEHGIEVDRWQIFRSRKVTV